MRLRDGWSAPSRWFGCSFAVFVHTATDRHRRLEGSRAAQDGRTDGPPGLFHAGMRLAFSAYVTY